MKQNSSTDSSVSQSDADAISRRAYELWEKEGRPDGSDLRHWLQAEQEIGSGQSTSDDARESDSSLRREEGVGSGSIIPPNTGSDVRPLEGTRAAAALNRGAKRSSNAPFGGEKSSPGNGNNSLAARRKPTNAPPL